MNFETMIRDAYNESIWGVRKGDKEKEIKFLQNYFKSAKKIVIPTSNEIKIKVINDVLNEFGLSKAEHLDINTNIADLNRMPALFKAILALDQIECDLIIARGRLGVPGSGSMLIIIDNKGRILTASTSSSHVVHKKEIKDALYDEITNALIRIGLKRVK